MKIQKKKNKRVDKHIALRLPATDDAKVQNLSAELGVSSQFLIRESIHSFVKNIE